VTATTTMFKRLRVVFGIQRFFRTFGKIRRCDIYYDCNDGPTVMVRLASNSSFHAADHSPKVIFRQDFLIGTLSKSILMMFDR